MMESFSRRSSPGELILASSGDEDSSVTTDRQGYNHVNTMNMMEHQHEEQHGGSEDVASTRQHSRQSTRSQEDELLLGTATSGINTLTGGTANHEENDHNDGIFNNPNYNTGSADVSSYSSPRRRALTLSDQQHVYCSRVSSVGNSFVHGAAALDSDDLADLIMTTSSANARGSSGSPLRGSSLARLGLSLHNGICLEQMRARLAGVREGVGNVGNGAGGAAGRSGAIAGTTSRPRSAQHCSCFSGAMRSLSTTARSPAAGSSGVPSGSSTITNTATASAMPPGSSAGRGSPSITAAIATTDGRSTAAASLPNQQQDTTRSLLLTPLTEQDSTSPSPESAAGSITTTAGGESSCLYHYGGMLTGAGGGPGGCTRSAEQLEAACRGATMESVSAISTRLSSPAAPSPSYHAPARYFSDEELIQLQLMSPTETGIGTPCSTSCRLVATDGPPTEEEGTTSNEPVLGVEDEEQDEGDLQDVDHVECDQVGTTIDAYDIENQLLMCANNVVEAQGSNTSPSLLNEASSSTSSSASFSTRKRSMPKSTGDTPYVRAGEATRRRWFRSKRRSKASQNEQETVVIQPNKRLLTRRARGVLMPRNKRASKSRNGALTNRICCLGGIVIGTCVVCSLCPNEILRRCKELVPLKSTFDFGPMRKALLDTTAQMKTHLSDQLGGLGATTPPASDPANKNGGAPDVVAAPARAFLGGGRRTSGVDGVSFEIKGEIDICVEPGSGRAQDHDEALVLRSRSRIPPAVAGSPAARPLVSPTPTQGGQSGTSTTSTSQPSSSCTTGTTPTSGCSFSLLGNNRVCVVPAALVVGASVAVKTSKSRRNAAALRRRANMDKKTSGASENENTSKASVGEGAVTPSSSTKKRASTASVEEGAVTPSSSTKKKAKSRLGQRLRSTFQSLMKKYIAAVQPRNSAEQQIYTETPSSEEVEETIRAFANAGTGSASSSGSASGASSSSSSSSSFTAAAASHKKAIIKPEVEDEPPSSRTPSSSSRTSSDEKNTSTPKEDEHHTLLSETESTLRGLFVGFLEGFTGIDDVRALGKSEKQLLNDVKVDVGLLKHAAKRLQAAKSYFTDQNWVGFVAAMTDAVGNLSEVFGSAGRLQEEFRENAVAMWDIEKALTTLQNPIAVQSAFTNWAKDILMNRALMEEEVTKAMEAVGTGDSQTVGQEVGKLVRLIVGGGDVSADKKESPPEQDAKTDPPVVHEEVNNALPLSWRQQKKGRAEKVVAGGKREQGDDVVLMDEGDVDDNQSTSRSTIVRTPTSSASIASMDASPTSSGSASTTSNEAGSASSSTNTFPSTGSSSSTPSTGSSSSSTPSTGSSSSSTPPSLPQRGPAATSSKASSEADKIANTTPTDSQFFDAVTGTSTQLFEGFMEGIGLGSADTLLKESEADGFELYRAAMLMGQGLNQGSLDQFATGLTHFGEAMQKFKPLWQDAIKSDEDAEKLVNGLRYLAADRGDLREIGAIIARHFRSQRDPMLVDLQEAVGDLRRKAWRELGKAVGEILKEMYVNPQNFQDRPHIVALLTRVRRERLLPLALHGIISKAGTIFQSRTVKN
ncbi:unnamed protein product [Amoebophrya sp. A25]|nr:unnamed protein product [Amoebophrya sp. A25]|eukprot:GSA25T00007033001.1